MRKFVKLYLAITAIFLSATANAQLGRLPAGSIPPVDISTTTQVGMLRLDNISEIKDKDLRMMGSVYLQDDWQNADLTTSSGHTFSGIPVKYDLQNNLIEINFKDGVKVLSGEYVKMVEFSVGSDAEKSVFINPRHDGSFEEPFTTGLYKVIIKGDKAQLLTRTVLKKVKPNYSPIMDVGSKSVELLKQELLYIANGKNLVELNAKDAYRVFGSREQEMKRYAKNKRLRITTLEDAVVLVHYFNSLL